MNTKFLETLLMKLSALLMKQAFRITKMYQIHQNQSMWLFMGSNVEISTSFLKLKFSLGTHSSIFHHFSSQFSITLDAISKSSKGIKRFSGPHFSLIKILHLSMGKITCLFWSRKRVDWFRLVRLNKNIWLCLLSFSLQFFCS